MSRERTPGPAAAVTEELTAVLAVLWDAGGAAAPNPRETAATTSWICLPSLADPRLLVPSESPRAAAAVLRSHGQGDGVKIALRNGLLRSAARTGALGRLARRRVTVAAGPGGLLARAARLTSESSLLAGVQVGPPRANRKPVLSLVTRDGRLVAFVKVGTNPLTRALLSNEARALSRLGGELTGEVSVSRLLHHGPVGELTVLIQSALPTWDKCVPETESRRHRAMQALAAAGGPLRPAVPLAAMPAWQRTRETLRRLSTSAAASVARTAQQVVDGTPGPVPMGAWHGDWHPRNVAFQAGRVLVWDLERFEHGVPLGWDELHWSLHKRLASTSGDPTSVGYDLLREAPRHLHPFGIPTEAARATAGLYLAHLAARYLEDGQAAAGVRLGRIESWIMPALTYSWPETAPTGPR